MSAGMRAAPERFMMLVRLLGEISVITDESPSFTPTGTSASVLAFLALAEGRLVATETLIDAVWDIPPETARNAIQVAVSRLRRGLGSGLLLGNRYGYRLSAAVLRIDIVEAGQLLKQALVHLDEGRFGSAYDLSEKSAQLFVGEPLAGLQSSAAVAAKQRAKEVRSAVAIVQAQSSLRLGQPMEATAVLRDEISREPLNEAAYALLMEAQVSAGRGPDALRSYDSLRQALADELGVSPSREVEEAFLQILNGTNRPGAHSLDIAPTPVSSPKVDLPFPSRPLIGRQAEVRSTAQVIEDGNRVVTLVGPGGIGKTRLAIAVAREAARSALRPVVFVDLVPATNADETQRAAAQAVGFEPADLLSALEGSEALLVLDNAEHVLVHVRSMVSSLLARTSVSVLITSRSPIRVPGERIIEVGPLDVGTLDSPGVQLLLSLVGPEADQNLAPLDLIPLARAIDGVPLFLELIAGALRWNSVAEVLGQLPEYLQSQDPGLTELQNQRHLSAANVINWSIDQCSSNCRAALAALATIQGEFSEPAAHAVIDAAAPSLLSRSILSELLDLSLVMRVPYPGIIKFRLLQPVKLYARESGRLPAPGWEVHRARSEYYLSALTRVHQGRGPWSDAYTEMIEAEDSNLSPALEWSFANDTSLVMEYGAAVLYGWGIKSRHAEVENAVRGALGLSGGTALQRTLLKLSWLSSLLMQEGSDGRLLDQLSNDIEPEASGFSDYWFNAWVDTQETRMRLEGNLKAALAWTDSYRITGGPDYRATSRAAIFASLGHWKNAAQELQRSVDQGAFPDYSWNDFYKKSALGYLYLVQGALELAGPLLDDALILAQRKSLVIPRIEVSINKAWLSLASGAPRDALRSVHSILTEPIGLNRPGFFIELMTLSGLSILELGNSAEAALIAREVSRRAPAIRGMLDAYVNTAVDRLLEATRAEAPSDWLETINASRLSQIIDSLLRQGQPKS
ncbi:putative ATPase/DNA-binding SARP family transcriptional activator [Arthrobacter sp. TE12231]